MATRTLKKVFQYQLTNVDSEIYLCPALTTITIVALYKVNVSGVDRTFRLHQVNAGGVSSAGNPLYYDEPILANRLHPRIDSGIVLEAGQSLRGLSSVTLTVTLTAFGIQSVEAL